MSSTNVKIILSSTYRRLLGEPSNALIKLEVKSERTIGLILINSRQRDGCASAKRLVSSGDETIFNNASCACSAAVSRLESGDC